LGELHNFRTTRDNALQKNLCRVCNANSADLPAKLDHRKADNPYKSRYGEDEWEKKLNESSGMGPYVSIKSLVENIISECESMMKGTKHEHDWVFYHDALSLMTAKETVSWMDEREGLLQKMDFASKWLT
jgi:hypothetical protein